MYASLIILAAIVFLTQLYAIVLCFFFSTLEGTVAFKINEILSPKINTVSSGATSNDRILHLTSRISFVARVDATSSEA
jgi:uncharacterized protein involved in cysteine biosynthesis